MKPDTPVSSSGGFPRIAVLLLAMGVAFVLGVVVDRSLLGPDADGQGADDTARGGGVGPKSSRQAAKAGGSAGEGRLSRSDREAGRRDDHREPAGDDDPIPEQVRLVLEDLERGGRMDAATAAAILEQVSSHRHRRHVLEHLAAHWARRDPEAALAWSESLAGLDQRIALEAIMHGWSQVDPRGAARYAAELPKSEHSLHVLRHLSRVWAEQDRGAALEWGLAQTDPVLRQRALAGVVEVWGHADPGAAAEFAMSLESPYERREVLSAVARQWSGQDMEAAMDWAAGLPEEDGARATHAILRQIAEREPGRAATLYEELTASLPETDLRAGRFREMVHEIAAMWSSSSPREAADWAVGLPDAAELRRAAVAEVAEHWLRVDSMAAGDWILQLPEGPLRDSAAERVVGSTVQSDPAAAFAWANSVSEDGHRAGLLHEVLRRWHASDPGAARGALQEARLPGEHRAELQELFGGAEPPPAPGPDGQPPSP